jgi:hypothetical protein
VLFIELHFSFSWTLRRTGDANVLALALRDILESAPRSPAPFSARQICPVEEGPAQKPLFFTFSSLTFDLILPFDRRAP